MTSCQISLAAIHLFLAFVFLKQEIWGEGTSVERRKLQRCVTYKIQHKSITSFAEGKVLDVATCMQCLSQKNLKHFAVCVTRFDQSKCVICRVIFALGKSRFQIVLVISTLYCRGKLLEHFVLIAVASRADRVRSRPEQETSAGRLSVVSEVRG